MAAREGTMGPPTGIAGTTPASTDLDPEERAAAGRVGPGARVAP
jgi:hypothetical protein